ncbi:MAG: hypothetical protein DCC59_07645 [Chloroflexi bacterium]|nr:MAG: hypothetical protein DCC59_07645 [Chloroflexota bacterium]
MSALANDLIVHVGALLVRLNAILDVLLPWAALGGMVVHNLAFFFKNRKKRDVIQQIIIWIIAELLAVVVFWAAPWLVIQRFPELSWISPWWKWAILAAVSVAIVWFYGHENGEKRWLYSFLAHFGVVLLGWWRLGGWAGVLFISIPLIVTYYAALYILAMSVLPASNPEDRDERWKRFIILAAYSWGFQFPIHVVADHAWKSPELRIRGDYTRDYKVPGLIWTKSHHVVGITGGTQFNRVDGPGVIFTGKLERALQIIDLRLQIRSNKIDVVSKDGVSFSAVAFAAFRMDPDTWQSKTQARVRAMNPLLGEAKEPSYTTGSFPFSHRRVQAAIGTTSVKTVVLDKALHWDQWALNVVTEEARKIISQKNLDELWRPAGDKEGVSAMDDIAMELKARVEWTLRANGIVLAVARVVNFSFPNKNGIEEQQIAAWGADWKRRRAEKLAEAEAAAERDQQEARAYAEAQLLDSIAEALQKTGGGEELKKRVIAMRYLSALQDFAHKNTPEEEEKIKELHDSIRGQ